MPEPACLAWSVHVPGGRTCFKKMLLSLEEKTKSHIAQMHYLTERLYVRRGDPDLITEPVRRQIAVSALPTSSLSSIDVPSRPFTLLTRP